MAIAPISTAPVVRIAADLPMNASEACTQTLGAIAAKGGGKSYLASVFVEQLYAAGAPFAVFDPIGNWNALTLAADGKAPGLGVVVIGGERADVPLVEDAAEALGDYLVGSGVSAVLDVSELSKTRRKVYVAAIAEAMFRAARRAKRPYMIVLEEAQLFAPQHASGGEERMLGAITDIVRLGRNYGLGSMLVTQRPQSVSKEVLNQVECLFVGQLRGPQERKAIGGWITEQGIAALRDGLDELPKLSPGEFFCWSPSWLRIFRKVRIAKKTTFDGSSTPVLGQSSRALPAKAARAGLGSVIAALKGLAPIEDEPAAAPAPANGVDHGELLRELDELRERNDALTFELGLKTAALEAIDGVLAGLPERVAKVERELPPPPKRRTIEPPGLQRIPGEVPRRAVVPNDVDGPGRAVLGMLAWQKGPISRKRLALLCRYAAGGGGFGNVLSRLRVPGFIEGSGDIAITDAGRKAAGKVEQPPRDPDALFQWWLAHPRVDGAMDKILRALRSARRPLTSIELAERAGYVPNTGGFNNPLSRLRTLGLVEGKGREKIQLAEELR